MRPSSGDLAVLKLGDTPIGRAAGHGRMIDCDKLGISFHQSLGERLGIPDSEATPALPDLVRVRARS